MWCVAFVGLFFPGLGSGRGAVLWGLVGVWEFSLCSLLVGGVVVAGDLVGGLMMLMARVVWVMQLVIAPLVVRMARVV